GWHMSDIACNYKPQYGPTGTGWDEIMVNGPLVSGSQDGLLHRASDGQWHYFEYHFKTDTNRANGIWQLWIDGVLKVDRSDVDYIGSLFGHVVVGSNHTPALNGGCAYVDYDDITISTTGPIGPVPTGPDTTPPTRSNGSPTGTLPAGTTSVNMNLTTNEPATCKYSTTPGIAYPSMTNTLSGAGATSHTAQVSGLQDNQTYKYYVRCNDTSGNNNTDDFPRTFSVANPSVCGLNGCEPGETCSTCPADCPCSSGICCSGSCQSPACSQSSDCGANTVCTTYTCSNPGTCSASCSSVSVTQCINSDGCCPSGCTSATDSDCPSTGLCTGLSLLIHLDNNSQYGESPTHVYDFSGNGNNGTVSGATFASGEFGYGLAFNATASQMVRLGNSDTLGMVGQPITISSWIYPSTASSNLIYCRNVSNNDGIKFYLAATNSIYLRVLGSTILSRQSSNNAITLNAWQHVLVTWDGSTTAANAHIYVNGAEVTYQTTTNGASLTSTAGQQATIGNRFGGGQGFNGTIDEVIVFNRILSAQEIQSLYSSGQPISCGICIHKSDTNCDNCVDGLELFAFIDLWKINSSDVTLREIIEAIGLWKRGC
ncbi:MAG: hypothetical protein MUP55_04745, partial [Candidatus Aenigmarchaeota archaeon]|nr:hypothetical protein [Candidatus Aenigmarchaeota archaeon]